MTRDEVFNALAAIGVKKAVVSFYGGNDEGYCEEAECHLSDEEAATFLTEGNSGVVGIDQVADDPGGLQEALEKPIWDRYHSFAGDYSVTGNLIWDVQARTVELDKSETEYVHSKELV